MISLKDAIYELNHNVEFKGARCVTEGEVVIYLRELERLFELQEQGRLIVQEHGQWDYNKYRQMYCSNCGQYPEIAVEWNYCPNCGAKMDEVE